MGLSYKSACKSGKIIPAKSMCTDEILCHDKCKRKCGSKINLEERKKIFDSFYKLDGEGQNCYLFKSIEPFKPISIRADAKNHHILSFRSKYYVIAICKKAFGRLHAVTYSKIDYLLNQMKAGASAPKPSERGKHDNRPRQNSKC